MRRGSATVALAVALWWVSLASGADDERGEGGASARPRHLVVISVDTLRPDHLGSYGYPRPTSPRLDAFAAQGTLYEHALATSPWTLPSHASLLTGLYPRHHGADRANRSLSAEVTTLAEQLAAQGFVTGAVVNCVYLNKFGIERGFDDLVYVKESLFERTPSGVTDAAIAWLEGRDPERPTFLFVHYYDVHSDYGADPSIEAQFVRREKRNVDGSTPQLLLHRYGRVKLAPSDAVDLIDLYDAGIRQLDDDFGRLIDHLAAEGWLEESLVVVTSDHGEEFMEHGGLLHGLTQFLEVLRIPLFMRGPGVPAGVRVATPVSLVDVAPTALSLLGAPLPAGLDGMPVGPESSPPGDRPLFSESDLVFDPVTRAKGLGSDRTVQRGRYRLHRDVITGRTALYDVVADPFEAADVADRHPDALHRLGRDLDAFLAGQRQGGAAPELSDEERRRLEALGYGR